jgi:predicted ester cyclase
MKPTLRCSDLDQQLACPGSRTLKAIVRRRSGDEGTEGTVIHSRIAWKLFEELDASGVDPAMGSKPPQNNLTDWMVNFCFREVQDNTPTDWSLECEMALAYEFDQFILSGHIDCVAISPDATEAIGWDWKTGYVAVDAAEMNEQVLGYIVLLKRAYPSLRKVTFYIVQPRNDEDEGFERVSKVELNLGSGGLDFIMLQFEKRIEQALADPMQLNAGLKQCRFCVGCSCPELQAKQKEQKMKLTPEILATIKAEPDDAVLGDFVVNAKMLDQPQKDATEMAKERIDGKGYIDAACGTRITLKTENGAYKVLDAPKFYRELTTLVPEPDKRANALSFSMTRIKDTIAEVMGIPKTGKSAINAETVFDAKFRPLVEQGKRKKFIFQ